MDYKNEKIDDNKKYIMCRDKYFIIFDYDIRIFNNKHQMILEINTFPNDPRELLKLTNHFN